MKTSLDWEECLRLSNHKEDLAKDLLNMLQKELPLFQQSLKEAIRSNDQKQLQYHAHKLHGACCYIGVPHLRQLIEQLETQMNTLKKDQLENLINQIDKEINSVLNAIKNYER